MWFRLPGLLLTFVQLVSCLNHFQGSLQLLFNLHHVKGTRICPGSRPTDEDHQAVLPYLCRLLGQKPWPEADRQTHSFGSCRLL